MAITEQDVLDNAADIAQLINGAPADVDIGALPEETTWANTDFAHIQKSGVDSKIQKANFGGDVSAIHKAIAGEINAITPKAAPIGADKLLIEDSAASWAKKSIILTSLLKKQYIAGNTYNTVLLDITGSTTGITRGVFVPYQTIDGAWRLRFNFVVDHASSASLTFTIAGVTFKSVGAYSQSCSGINFAGSNWTMAYTVPATSNILVFHGQVTVKSSISGDVELDSKPTWAD